MQSSSSRFNTALAGSPVWSQPARAKFHSEPVITRAILWGVLRSPKQERKLAVIGSLQESSNPQRAFYFAFGSRLMALIAIAELGIFAITTLTSWLSGGNILIQMFMFAVLSLSVTSGIASKVLIDRAGEAIYRYENDPSYKGDVEYAPVSFSTLDLSFSLMAGIGASFVIYVIMRFFF